MKFHSALLATALATAVAANPLPAEGSLADGFIAQSTEQGHASGGEEFVVILDEEAETPPEVADILSKLTLTSGHDDVRYTFNNGAFKGFVANMNDHCLDALANMTGVSIVEKSVVVKTRETRGGAPWGLQGLSSQSTVTGDPNALAFTYSFKDEAPLGDGVDIYVIDTGVFTDHIAFGGRARAGFSFEASNNDGDGHGTHVAGTAAGNILGVASNANIWAVKVLGADGSGTTADTLMGMDWVIRNHNSRKDQPGFVGSIMSMSWGLNNHNSGIDRAIRSASEIGIHMSVAAGNSNTDSCNASPASSGGSEGPAIVVGSVGQGNAISRFSNTGRCNDVYAPGEGIVSSWIGATNYVNALDGTSMACPHVTGLMAYLMTENPALRADTAAMKAAVRNLARSNVVQGRTFPGDPMLLAFNGGESANLARRAATAASAPRIRLVPKRSLVARYAAAVRDFVLRRDDVTLELAQTDQKLRW